jgi:uncharacterized BrkB/YihY/UPF0761 family membrane protein
MLARAWAEAKREETAWAAWLWDVYDRDRACGGGLLAGALAYRLFIWLLPLVLVLVAGLGIVSSAASESPGEIAGRGGLSGLVTASVADAARSGARWYALLIGVPVLLYATRTLAFLALLLVFPLVSSIATAARASSLAVGLVATVTVSLVYAGLWLLVSLLLPHGAASHTALIPGSVVFGVGTFALHVFSAYFVAPLAASRQDTYGSLGAAAALLLGLYFVGRLLVVCAAVNATLWERRHDAGPGAVGTAARS